MIFRCATLTCAFAFLPGLAIAKTESPTTDTFALAARHYLFFAAATSQSLVRVSIPEGERRAFLSGGKTSVKSFSEFLIYWPGAGLGPDDFRRCKDMFLKVHDEVSTRIAMGMTRDIEVYELCKFRTAEPRPAFQYLVLNEAVLDRLRSEFPRKPPPLGVYIRTQVVIPRIRMFD